MKTKCLSYLVAGICAISLGSGNVFAQTANSDTAQYNKIVEYKGQAERLIHFLAYAMNTLADDQNPASEKETVVKESYLKFFKNDKVQIEDDLDEKRDMPISKDVQAYLKDIDFFFVKAKFEFIIENIEHFVNENNVLYFRVTLSRVLTGFTIGGDTVKSTRKRYVEINVDEAENDLKIVSIYTTKLNADKELLDWWKNMDADWKAFFTEKYKLTEPITSGRIKQLQEITELDFTNKKTFSDWTVLSNFSDLKKLNLAGTEISSLLPIRNYTKLEVLDISNTKIVDISMLKYITELKELYIADTKVSDATIISNFRKLEKINIENTEITGTEFIKELTLLTDIRLSGTKIANISYLKYIIKPELIKISGTNVTDLSAIAGKNSLVYLFAERTGIVDLSPIKGLQNLKHLYLNGCAIDNLDALTGLPKLEMVFCDNTKISKTKADEFMQKHKKALVVYKSEVLLNWWKTMSADWKEVLSAKLKVGNNPDTETLHKIIATETISIAGNKKLRDIEPLRQLVDLKTLDISNTSVSNLQPISDLIDLKEINASHTEIRNLLPLNKVKSLAKLNISYTKIADIEALAGLSELELLIADSTQVSIIKPLLLLSKLTKAYFDFTKITEDAVYSFNKQNSKCLVVWQTDSLLKVWNTVNPEWQQIFRAHTALDKEPTREQLHSWITLKSIELKDRFDINSIDVLRNLKMLESLELVSTQVTNYSVLGSLKELRTLKINNSPIPDLEAVAGNVNLVSLNIENTPVKSLKFIESLKNLEYLNIAGTKVKSLKQVALLFKLKSVDCFNSPVASIKELGVLKNLESLKCYNTKLTVKEVDAFKLACPNCKVVHY